MDALTDLEPNLRSKKERLTPQEEQLIQSWKIRAQRTFFVGSIGGGFVGWLATKRLNRAARTAVCVGAAAFTGLWQLTKAVDSTVDHLLSLQGTRVQGELTNLLLRKGWNDPWVREYVLKYFYPEVVYTDSSVDRPLLRLRYRNIYGEPVTPQNQSTPKSDKSYSKEKNLNMTNMARKQAYVTAGVSVGNGNPFDLVFGHPEESVEDVSPDDAPRSLSRRQARREKRRHRRHMQHRQETEI